jgi:hypothetical protein
MAQSIIELTKITPSASNYELHYKKLDRKHYFSLRAKGKNGEPYFTLKPLSAISINDVVFETPEELIEAFNENFNSGEETPQEAISYIRRHDFVSNVSYCGYAKKGSSEDDSVWTISKIVVAIEGTTTTTTATNVKWSERLTINYN